jgi:hypothetical protein
MIENFPQDVGKLLASMWELMEGRGFDGDVNSGKEKF